ncbi:MAG: hypothetical protein CMB82_09465 [Flammeovirgaceae bacterium]|nr:hypothetical protein [Flammeovirgaceae bacterium]
MKKNIITLLALIFPRIFVRKAYKKLTLPKFYPYREYEKNILEDALITNVTFKKGNIKTYKWTGGPKKILLIHGWEGRVTNFSVLIHQLIKAGFTVYGFDAPSHGLSDKVKTSLFDFVDLVGEMIERIKPEIAVSHSFGAVATIYSLAQNSDLKLDKYVLLTCPDKFLERIEAVAYDFGLTKGVVNRLIVKIERDHNIDVKKLNVSEFVKKAKVSKAYILHDQDDRQLPLSQAVYVDQNWPNSELEIVQGTGHFRILRDEGVIEKILKFIKS